MHIGICTIRLHIPETHDLKAKRQVVKSVVERVRSRFNVSIAEVEDHNLWQSAVLGVACVSTDASHAHEMLTKVVEFIERSRLDADLYDYEIEVLTA
ncbi:MAG: DUF503 domain-containing protein [Chloroflexi bacterium]|nr:DUF503 domain-containing protein [Chloroflexota bacterium]